MKHFIFIIFILFSFNSFGQSISLEEASDEIDRLLKAYPNCTKIDIVIAIQDAKNGKRLKKLSDIEKKLLKRKCSN